MIHEMGIGKPVYKLTFTKTVCHWNPEKGAGVKNDGVIDTSHWMHDLRDLAGTITPDDSKTFEQQIKDFIYERVGYDGDYLSIMDDGRISFNRIEDNEGNVIKDDKGRTDQLFIVDYDLFIEIHYIFVPSPQRLGVLLPNADKNY